MELEPRTGRVISGRDLRYVLTVVLLDQRRALTIVELVGALDAMGLAVRGRASKTIADALRWEIRRGRVRRAGRGRYRTGTIPRSTQWWLRQHALRVREGGSVAVHELQVRLRRLEQRSF